MNSARPGFVANAGRAARARKIRAVLEQAGGSDMTGRRLPDVGSGSGSGEIARLLGACCEVVSVDPCDQRVLRHGYRYLRAGTTLPFADGSFDLAASNHVIEHLNDAASHVRELARVLRPASPPRTGRGPGKSTTGVVPALAAGISVRTRCAAWDASPSRRACTRRWRD